MNPLAIFDNPIFVKHLRSRLRPGQALPGLAVVLIICLIIMYAGYQLNAFKNGTAFGVVLTVQAIVLGIIGATQISAAVGGARESGILDFHRVTPMSPMAITLGFFFGAPIREYAMYAVTIPFALICVANEAPEFWGFVQIQIILFLGTWILHAFSLFNALVMKKPRAGARGAIGLFFFIMMMSGNLIATFGNAARFANESPRLGFFGVQLPWLAVVFIYMIPFMYFLLIASSRKMDTERAHALSKSQAVACLGTMSLLILGAIWDISVKYESLVVLYATMAIAMLMTLPVTPNLGEYTKGFRRAEKQGMRNLMPWDDLALNRLTVAALAMIVLIVPTVAWQAIEMRSNPDAGRAGFQYGLTIAIGTLVVAYVGLALQYFMLVFPKRGKVILALFLFLTWMVPVVLGVIAGVSGGQGGERLGVILSSLSPLVGIAMSAVMPPDVSALEVGQMTIQSCALIPALTFAFLFNMLITGTTRRAVAEIRAAEGDPSRKPQPEFA